MQNLFALDNIYLTFIREYVERRMKQNLVHLSSFKSNKPNFDPFYMIRTDDQFYMINLNSHRFSKFFKAF